MATPSPGQSKTEDLVKWKHIAQTLKKNLFFPPNDPHNHEQKLIEMFKEYCQQIATLTVDRTYLITHLCGAYYTDDDKEFMFYKPLTQLNYNKLNKRHQFYHILLHRYVPLSELNQSNVAQILPRIIGKHTANVERRDIQRIVRKESIDGSKLKNIVSKNRLAQICGSVSISDTQWQEIRFYMKGWKLNLSPITVECIPNTLQECNTHHLILVVYIIAKRSNRKDASKPFHTSAIKAFLNQNKMNGKQIASITPKQFVSRAKEEPYKIPPGTSNIIVNEIKSYFNEKETAQKTSRSRTIPKPRHDQDEKKSEMEHEHNRVPLHNNTVIEEEEYKSPLHDIKECSDAQTMYIVNRILDETNKKSLKKHKELLRSYWREHPMDAQKLEQLGRVPFMEQIAHHFDDRSLKGAAGQLYNEIRDYEVESIDWHHVENELETFETMDEKYEDDKMLDEKEVKSCLQNDQRKKPNKNAIPRTKSNETMKDPYPSYIYKSIWFKSDDDNLEALIDRCCKTIADQGNIWNDKQHIMGLYEDGLRLDDRDTRETYYDFVIKVYEAAGGNSFFDEFIEKHFEREYIIWKHKTENERLLTTKPQIFEVLKDVEFSKFDFSKDKNISWIEFQEYFRKNGFFVDKSILKDIFDRIDETNDKDGKITKTKFEQWKHHKHALEFPTAEINDVYGCHVYYDSDCNCYEFMDERKDSKSSQYITGLLNDARFSRKNIQWALFVQIENRKKRKMEARAMDGRSIPGGYWHILNDEDDENDLSKRIPFSSIRNQMLHKQDLRKIYELLQHYYTLKIEASDKTNLNAYLDPLSQRYCATNKADTMDGRDEDITFKINDMEYKLIWWNTRGRNDPNAFVLECLESMRSQSLCYMRFVHDPPRQKLCWKWYDNNNYVYQEYAVGSNCEIHDKAMQQLEVSFLSNISYNFDPEIFKDGFNPCLLNALARDLRHRFPNRDYALKCTFRSADRNIVSLEQMTFNHDDQTTWYRPVQRLIDGHNSLDFIFRGSDKFAKNWKLKYRLYTKEQQLYFFAFMVGIVALIKYIEIEFANQAVAIPLYMDEEDRIESHEIMDDVVNTRDVIKERITSAIYEGSVIPSSTVSQAAIDSNVRRRHFKTMRLKKFKVDGKESNVFLQKEDYGYFVFNQVEAEFLRLIECVRKFAMEYEAKDTEQCLWPWYRNSFHSDETVYRDNDNYEELLYRHNFLKAWHITDLIGKLRQYLKDSPPEKPIRFKRKFAAEFLLTPHQTERNINLVRNQLALLLDDILGDAYKTYTTSLADESILYITDQQKIENRKKKVIDTYCKEKINGDVNAIKECKENAPDLKAFINRICARNSDLNQHKSLFTTWSQLIEARDDLKQDISHSAMELNARVIKQVSNQLYWPRRIENTNRAFQDEPSENATALDIDRLRLPVFEAFMEFFFIESDQTIYTLIEAPLSHHMSGRDHHWYRCFVQSWRQTPLWYTYDHDVLLLELIFRHGLNLSAISDDLEGSKMAQYKIRLRCDEGNTMDDPYYEFKGWCNDRFNILHRLKYVFHIIIQNLNETEYGGCIPLIEIQIKNENDRPKCNTSSLWFTAYQKETVCNYIDTVNDCERVPGDDAKRISHMHKQDDETKLWCCNGILNSKTSCCNSDASNQNDCCPCLNQQPGYDSVYPMYDTELDVDIEGSELELACTGLHRTATLSFWANRENPEFMIRTHLPYMLSRRRWNSSRAALRIRQNDPFTARNIKIELLQSLQAFDLMLYGPPLVECIVRQMQKQNRSAYWHILSEILYALPYPLAIDVINDVSTKDILRHSASPKLLDQICYRLIQGSSFPASAALSVAEFFETLAELDVVQEEEWKAVSRKYEVMAYNEVNRVESDHVLFVLLNIPLMQHSGESLFSLALKEKRIYFLNNDRINSIIRHLWTTPFLRPNDRIDMRDPKYLKLLKSLFQYPFRFYFSAQGYHWISGTLYLLYFVFVCYYAYHRPLDLHDLDDESQTTAIELEFAFWFMNWGYITNEIIELSEKGPAQYLNIGAVGGQTNMWDVAISLFWIVLFVLRASFYHDNNTLDKQNTEPIHQAYMFIFGFQIMLLSMRAIALLSHTQYLGILWRTIKLMLFEILRFLVIFVVMMFGVVFGLWLITAANSCQFTTDDCDDFEAETMTDVFKYVFQVFIGTGDLGGVADQGIAIVFMVLATLFGSLILTNLLIALMTTKYENVQEEAKGELTYNAAALTQDLSQRSRIMPPPLNLVVIILVFFIDIINFFVAMVRPKKNIYACIGHQSFLNLQNFNILQCEHKERIKYQRIDHKCQSRLDFLRWFFMGCWYNWIKPKCDRACDRWRSCVSTKKEAKSKPKETKLNVHWRIHHNACYGVMILHTGTGTHTEQTPTGITMSTYCEKYETNRKHKIESKDKQLLKRLTRNNVLFCEFCYRPILLSSKKRTLSQLTTPYVALLNYTSAILFVVFPVAWIPLLLLFFILSIPEWIKECCCKDDANEYRHTDFDNEYFPNQFQTLQL
eukprot:787529_1